MNIIKTDGIILRSQDYLETSKIIVCYTKDQGKITLIAKGARRPKSKFGGALDLLNHIHLVYYSKENRELQLLSQAEIYFSFQSVSGDMSRLSLAMATAEMINQLELKEEPNTQLFGYLSETLTAIEKAKTPELILYQFIWRWLELSGFKPRLRRCLKCGQVPKGDRVIFKFSMGGYFCSTCFYASEETIRISTECIRLILELRDYGANQLMGKNKIGLQLGELKNITWRFLQHHVEGLRELKSLRFFEKISNHKEQRVGVV